MPASLNITVRQRRQSGVAGRHDQFQAESVLRSSGICTCALASSKKLIVFSCYLECGIKKLISQGAGFDVYGYSVILNNNQKLVVPRARYKDVKSAFIAYKGEV